ncbi:helix-turn-helix domain-containing protein [Deinococcus sp. HMF7604]|uniref:helix-turn-helix domain-containing protein n=1 Tax=Deinococcus betulae TaxID=2873312 RepID=UPI001CCCDAB8|nr:helix-turn-helix domain-containing protein [Deinococcus betulae]MBZ9749694.1 helix-turn-helix domain-containing protein [Deinococcus betulae]
MRGDSLDLRQRIVHAVQNGLTQAEVARHFQVSLATVERYWRLHRQQQPLAPRPIPGSPPRVLPPEQHDVLLRQLEAHPDWTLAEHVTLWREQHGPLSIATLWRRIQSLHWTRKKDPACRGT